MHAHLPNDFNQFNLILPHNNYYSRPSLGAMPRDFHHTIRSISLDKSSAEAKYNGSSVFKFLLFL